MRTPTFSLLVTLAGLLFSAHAQAFEIDATVTADNHYGLYVGNADGSALTLIGRNEYGSAGSTGGYNWQVPENYNFALGTDQYVYVVAWDDGGPQSWIGEFGLDNGNWIYSNRTDWVAIAGSGPNPGTNGELPSLAVLAQDILGATWQAPGAGVANGASPWGSIAGISGAAEFIWQDTLAASAPSDSTYTIYRTVSSANPGTSAPVPVPAPLALLLVGALPLLRRRVRTSRAVA